MPTTISLADAIATAPPRRAVADLLPEMFFVVGCQKSGTTWVQRLLDGHPAICCNGETYLAPLLLPLLRQAMGTYNARQKVGPEGCFQDADLAALARHCVQRLYERWTGGHVVEALGEKTPEHALCLPDLQRLFPAMKVIHIIRDGRDVAVSGWHHNLRKKGDAFREKFPDLPAYITYLLQGHWVPYITAARQFGAAHPDRYLEIRYEAMHHDGASHVKQLLTFLGVAADDAAVRACLEAGSFETLTQGRRRGDEDGASFFRKGVVGDWKNHFDDRCLEVFMQHGGGLLQQLGYET